MNRSLIAACLVAATVLAGCGGSKDASAQTPTYSSVDALKRAVVRAGVPCAAFEKPRTRLTVVTHAADWADCGSAIELSTYDRAADRDADLALMRAAKLSPIVAGSTWIVVPRSTTDAKKLAHALHGAIVR